MDTRDLGHDDLASVVELATQAHARLQARFPYLPVRDVTYFTPALDWLLHQYPAVGAFDQGRLIGFLGALVVDDFLHEGRGAYSPDFGNAVAAGLAAPEVWRMLYAAAASRWVADGALLHCLSLYVTDQEGISALVETGFGKAVVDAALDLTHCGQESAPGPGRIPAAPGMQPAEAARCRDAVAGDVPTLVRLSAGLAAHVSASPIFVRHAQGKTAAEWAARLVASDSIVLVAERHGTVVSYMTARAPQHDVSRAIHDPGTLAIDGAYTDPDARRRGVAAVLLRAMIARALSAGKRIVSVDYESANPQAAAFWSLRFTPFALSLRRSLGRSPVPSR